MKCSASVVAVLICLAVSSTSANPGIQVSVSNKGLAFLKEVVLAFVKPYLDQVNIGGLDGDGYEIRNMRMHNLDLGETQVLLEEPDIFGVTAAGARGTLSAYFRVYLEKEIDIGIFKIPVPKLFDFGTTASLTANHLNLNMKIKVEKNDQGKPKFSISSCDAAIGDIDVGVDLGGIEFFLEPLVNVVIDLFQGLFKGKIADVLCDVAKDELNSKAGDLTDLYDTTQFLIFGTYINIGLVTDPRVDGNKGIIGLDGRCYSESRNPGQTFPFTLPQSPVLHDDNKMAEVSINQFVFNTMIYSLWQNKVLDQTFTASDLLKILGRALRATELARFNRQFGRYGTKALKISVSARKAPKIFIKETGVTVTAEVSLAIGVDEIQARPLAYLGARVSLGGEVMVENNDLSAHISTIQVRASQSNVIPVDVLNKIIDAFLTEKVEFVLKKISSITFSIPSLYGFGTKDLTLVTRDNVVEVGADFVAV
ncbi:bactericidal permeability-increasing protein-like [Clavelina lepadiformis]|uniref:Lipid-binding serum glycoprotein C-terminal domain-containing protein n=1 Tax=Clavelina lepadiformis TaxID=159417 RepID=A0ABP0FU55_CLALP